MIAVVVKLSHDKKKSFRLYLSSPGSGQYCEVPMSTSITVNSTSILSCELAVSNVELKLTCDQAVFVVFLNN